MIHLINCKAYVTSLDKYISPLYDSKYCSRVWDIVKLNYCNCGFSTNESELLILEAATWLHPVMLFGILDDAHARQLFSIDGIRNATGYIIRLIRELYNIDNLDGVQKKLKPLIIFLYSAINVQQLSLDRWYNYFSIIREHPNCEDTWQALVHFYTFTPGENDDTLIKIYNNIKDPQLKKYADGLISDYFLILEEMIKLYQLDKVDYMKIWENKENMGK